MDAEDDDDQDLPAELRMNEYDEDEDNEMHNFQYNDNGEDDIAVRFIAFSCLIISTPLTNAHTPLLCR